MTHHPQSGDNWDLYENDGRDRLGWILVFENHLDYLEMRNRRSWEFTRRGGAAQSLREEVEEMLLREDLEALVPWLFGMASLVIQAGFSYLGIRLATSHQRRKEPPITQLRLNMGRARQSWRWDREGGEDVREVVAELKDFVELVSDRRAGHEDVMDAMVRAFDLIHDLLPDGERRSELWKEMRTALRRAKRRNRER